ncbi:MAG TPA: helix-turn-helix domain-containing protein, partial [Allosphingosinicella sp.]|nr:helix-turn-helix domain-containing protein [Allosphingosinicella sp.]
MTRLVPPGAEISRERTARRIERHHHIAPYAALVLRGGYLEAGDSGRFRAGAGDVLFHDAFEAHQDQFAAPGADILNLPLLAAPAIRYARIADPDALVRAAGRDPLEAAALLFEQLLDGGRPMEDWPDLLADDLRSDRVTSLAAWAGAHGLAPSSVSRGFRLAYGVAPQRYRADHRAARAARSLGRPGQSLAAIAADSGFA